MVPGGLFLPTTGQTIAKPGCIRTAIIPAAISFTMCRDTCRSNLAQIRQLRYITDDVCVGNVAGQRSTLRAVSLERLGKMDVRALPDFGRPRGLSILAAVFLPNISGNTSRALRACAEVSLVQTGFSRSARSGLRLRFIPLYITIVSPAKTHPLRALAGRQSTAAAKILDALLQKEPCGARQSSQTLNVVQPGKIAIKCANGQVPGLSCNLQY